MSDEPERDAWVHTDEWQLTDDQREALAKLRADAYRDGFAAGEAVERARHGEVLECEQDTVAAGRG